MTGRAAKSLAITLIVTGIIVGAWATFLRPHQTNNTANSPQATSTQQEPKVQTVTAENALEQKALDELQAFSDWLTANNAHGYIGELGWPGEGPDAQKWAALGDKWYAEAARHKLWATHWAAGSWWGNYPMRVYSSNSGTPGLNQALGQATVLEKYAKADSKLGGVNLAGMEFSTEKGFNNMNPGTPQQDYFYEPASSFSFLADRGITLIRLPIRWERIQPKLGGDLNQQEIAQIKLMLKSAADNNQSVILDLHNYASFEGIDRKYLLGERLTHAQFVDVWSKLSSEFKDTPGLLAYGLMNEPHDLPKATGGNAAKNWEQASQKVVNALREKGDNTLLMVAGYDWSSLARWSQNHPKSWINDPANNFRYEAHHYWDSNGSGYYETSYAKELQKLKD